MRKILLFINLVIFFSLFSSCTDVSINSMNEDKPIDIDSVAKGGVLSLNDGINIDFSLNDVDKKPDLLSITLTGPEGNVLIEKDIYIEDEDKNIEPLFLEKGAIEGLYRIQFDFYEGEELFYTEVRDFFVIEQNVTINCINSYPPVLYPKGGGLFNADILLANDNCFLRWAIDGETISEGLIADGYQNIQIEAPEEEGVYELSLEIFPFASKNGESYDFTSDNIKTIPVYVNKDQKAKQNEYSPAEDFLNLFHFRGSCNNSSDEELSGINNFESLTLPKLAVRNGFFGYYIEEESGFTAKNLFIPTKEGQLESSTLMMAVIPSVIVSEGQLFYTGYEDESLELTVKLMESGKLQASLKIHDENYLLETENEILNTEEYTSFSLNIFPTEDSLKLSFYKDGILDSEIDYEAPIDETPSWFNLSKEKQAGNTIIFGNGCFEGLVDELGVYYKGNRSIDPEEFKRAKLIEYGKRLMYADSFEGETEDLTFNDENIKTENGQLIIPPHASVDFPQIYPGNEKLVFNIELADNSTVNSDALFFADSTDSQIIAVDLSRVIDESGDAEFSLIFDTDQVTVQSNNNYHEISSFDKDFSSVIYSIVNNSELPLNLGSILILREPITKDETPLEKEM